MTKLSSKHDRIVTPYKEPKNNQGKNGTLSYILVGEKETQVIAVWRAWIAENMSQEPDAVLEALQTSRGFQLPSRFPTNDDVDHERYAAFFRLMGLK